MLRNFNELEESQESSSIIAEPIEYKSNTQIYTKLNDSFNSSQCLKNGSEHSFASHYSNEDEFYEGPKPVVQNFANPLRQQFMPKYEALQSRPASILKTTFLADDSNNYNFPKKIVSGKENSRVASVDRTKSTQERKSTSVDLKFSEEIQGGRMESERISELENQILKKDALIETLRTRVAKMVEELEENHRKASLNKASFSEDMQSKIHMLSAKSEENEKKTQELIAQSKELHLILDKKEQEISYLEQEIRQKRQEIDKKNDFISKLEYQVGSFESQKSYYDKINENLQTKLDNASKALDISNSHNNHLEEEVIRLEVIKRTQENEMKVIIDENAKSIAGINKKAEEFKEEARNCAKKLKESNERYENLNRAHGNLSSKLGNLEEQLTKLDALRTVPLKERHLRSISSNNRCDTSKQAENYFTFQNACENCSYKQAKSHKKAKSSICMKEIFREILEILELNNILEVIPAIKQLFLNKNEKKLVKKLVSLTKECLVQDRDKEVTPGQVWRVVKKVFQDYAGMMKKNVSTKAN